MLIFEICLMCIFPWPFYERFILFTFVVSDNDPPDITAAYFLGDFFLAVMFLRVFLAYRSVLNYSVYTDAFSKKLCNQYGFQNSMRFALKCLLVHYPGYLVLINGLLFTLVLAYLVRIFELPVLKLLPENYYTLDQYFNAVYVTIITITTVGYGDISPISKFGKVTMMAAALLGTVMISLMVLSVSSNFELNKEQSLAFRKIQSSCRASNTVVASVRYYIAKRQYYMHKLLTDPNILETSTFLQIAKDKKTWIKYCDP